MLPFHPIAVVVGKLGECLVIVRVLRDHRRSTEEVPLVVKVVLGAESVCHGVELLSLNVFERVLDPSDGSTASPPTLPCHSLGADVPVPAGDMLPVRLEILVLVLEVVDLEELVVALDRWGGHRERRLGRPLRVRRDRRHGCALLQSQSFEELSLGVYV
jgi:hypothetical protein